jgi:hypothetical protein
MIKKAFDANGIKFAFPTVQIAGDSEPSSAASAAVAQRPRIGQTRRGVARRKRMRTIPRNRSARLPGWTVGLVPGFCMSVAEIACACGLTVLGRR